MPNTVGPYPTLNGVGIWTRREEAWGVARIERAATLADSLPD